MFKEISEYYDDEMFKRAVIFLDTKTDTFGIDYYKGKTMIDSENFPGYALCYVEDAADNWVRGIKKINKE